MSLVLSNKVGKNTKKTEGICGDFLIIVYNMR